MSTEQLNQEPVNSDEGKVPARYQSQIFRRTASGDGNWYQFDDRMHYYAKFWNVPSDKKLVACLTFVHGLGEHIHRYEYIFQKFADSGIRVYSWDQRGFGRTGKKNNDLGYNHGWKKVMQDVSTAIEKNRIKDVPMFLYGHSMGGLIVTSFTQLRGQESNLNGVIISSPAIEPAPKIQESWVMVTVGSLLAYVIPSFAIKQKISVNDLSHDSKNNEDFLADIYCHPYISIGTGSDLLGEGKRLLNSGYVNYPTDIPLLFVHGTGDQITSPAASKKFYDHISAKDKNYRAWDGYYHELHNEPDIKDELIQLYIDWMLKRLSPCRS